MEADDKRITEAAEQARKIAELARISLAQLIEAMNKLAEEVKRASKELMAFEVEEIDLERFIQDIRLAKRRQSKTGWGYKSKFIPKQNRVQPKTKWFRTRSNPFNKRGGQRARDKPDRQPEKSERK